MVFIWSKVLNIFGWSWLLEILYKQVKQANRTLIFRLHFCFNIHPWPWSLKAQRDDGGQRDPHPWALKELQHLICSTWEKLKKPAHCSKSTLMGALFFLTLLLGFIFSLTHPSVECICLLMLESNVRKKKRVSHHKRNKIMILHKREFICQCTRTEHGDQTNKETVVIYMTNFI